MNQDGRLHRDARRRTSARFVPGSPHARGLPAERLILGGDHLGPNPWRNEPAEAAMAKAETLVRSYAEAGFAKIHLDASMACAGDPDPLPPELVAARAVRLATAAEAAGAPAGLRHRHRGAGAGRGARGDRQPCGHAHRGSRPDDRGARAGVRRGGPDRRLGACPGGRGAARRGVRQRAGRRLRARGGQPSWRRRSAACRDWRSRRTPPTTRPRPR